MPELKLAKLPDRTPVKLTIVISPDLRQALSDYADVYREAYGEAETVAYDPFVPRERPRVCKGAPGGGAWPVTR